MQETACGQLRAWQDLGVDVELAINASPRELARPGFARRLCERMAAHGVRPGSLAIEIIESALVDTEAVSPVLEALGDWACAWRSTTSAPVSPRSPACAT